LDDAGQIRAVDLDVTRPFKLVARSMIIERDVRVIVAAGV
jgi:hypothetical protein